MAEPSASPAGESRGPHPALKAMLLCHYAIREFGTNNVTLVGIFDRIAASAFPVEYRGPLAIYARLTDAAGRYRFRLELVRLEDEMAIGRLESAVTVEDRTGSHEMTFVINGVSFERPGNYEFRLSANGRYLGGTPLGVVLSTPSAE